MWKATEGKHSKRSGVTDNECSDDERQSDCRECRIIWKANDSERGEVSVESNGKM